MKKTWLLDAGHGGLNPQTGIYVTKGKRHIFEDGLTIYEGVFNRAVREKLITLINDDSNMDWFLINYGWKDISLSSRVKRANNLHKLHENCVYISIHGNGGGGTGHEVYTSKGETKSDIIAEMWVEKMEEHFPNQVSRGEKDRDFYVLKNTKCPAILTENFFMDKRKDAEIMLSEEGQWNLAKALYDVMKAVDKNPLI